MTLMKRKRKVILIIIVTLSIFILVFSAFVISKTNKERRDMKYIEKLLSIEFPGSTVWGHSQIEYWMDSSIVCTFKIDKKDIPLLLGKIQPENTIVWSKQNAYLIDKRKPGRWFDVDKIKDFKATKIYYPDEHSVLKILYDWPILQAEMFKSS